MKHQFKVLAGRHVDRGRIYKTGEIVSSEADLVAAFPGKFEIVSRPVPSPEPSGEQEEFLNSQPKEEAEVLVQGSPDSPASLRRRSKASGESASASKKKGKAKSPPAEEDWGEDD